jgi:methionyl-tRNA formyltransferase
MKILAIGYRNWSIDIYKNLAKKKIKIKIVKKEVSLKAIKRYNPEFILFYGWSKKISKSIVERYKCIMLHPSKLPKYAGGSPIQNQIIRNVKQSAVTLFRMSEKIDRGNIIFQKKISLSGNLNDIFKRIVSAGTLLSLKLFKNNYKEKKMKVTKVYLRRKPCESEITFKEIKSKNADYLYNKIRMLQDPYPNAYIKTADGKKIFLIQAKLEKNKK